ncbi:MAG: methyltransferase domain-containing protein [Rhodanobacteraceae bacterium]|nr:methyltransferase domain-containing protein [Rhodanobacteraceae bacterium]
MDRPAPPTERTFSQRRDGIYPWPDGSAGIACAFDVLEHVDDDTGLREMHRILRPGGRLLLTVPAHRWLWSRRDELAGHQRRYSRSLLSKRVRDAGFHIEQLFGFNSCCFH